VSYPIDIKELSFGYSADQHVLRDVTWRVGERDFVALIGPNGGGKTTLLRLVLGLERPRTGRVLLLGGDPRRTRHRVGYIPQRDAIDASTPHNALDVVLSGRLRGSRWGPCYGSSDRAAAEAALERVGLADQARQPLHRLSGGQRQRVRLARALAAESELLLLDEPLTGVDPGNEDRLMELLHELGRERCIVMVSHDIACVSRHVTHVACCHETLAVHRAEDMTVERLLATYHSGSRPLRHDHDGCPFGAGARD
jgi:zinc transport system ATP-binding protein